MQEKKTHKTSVGGQALIEGIMMQGPKGMATAVRKPDGDILTEYHEFHRLREKYKFLGWPLIRGAVNFFESMVIGYKTLMYSAEVSGMEEVEDRPVRRRGDGWRQSQQIRRGLLRRGQARRAWGRGLHGGSGSTAP